MKIMEETRYKMESTSSRSAKITDIELIPTKGKKKLTRKVLRALVVENPRSKQNTVKIAIVHQRRGKENKAWRDIGGPGLNRMKAKNAAKIIIDSSQTRQLFEHLVNLYKIGEEGIRLGKTVLEIADEEKVIRADRSRARLIRKLLEAKYGEEIWEALVENNPSLITKLSLVRVYAEREKAVEEFRKNISQEKGEEYWRVFLKGNKWAFGNSFIRIIEEKRIDLHHETDFPFEVEEGFMDLVEIKKPEISFWRLKSNGEKYLYRNKYLLPHSELQGAIAQVSKYILQAEKNISNIDYIESHGGVIPLKPNGFVVFGRSDDWEKREKEAFRLMNNSYHNVEIVTFDHLLRRAERILKVFKEETNKTKDEKN